MTVNTRYCSKLLQVPPPILCQLHLQGCHSFPDLSSSMCRPSLLSDKQNNQQIIQARHSQLLEKIIISHPFPLKHLILNTTIKITYKGRNLQISESILIQSEPNFPSLESDSSEEEIDDFVFFSTEGPIITL